MQTFQTLQVRTSQRREAAARCADPKAERSQRVLDALREADGRPCSVMEICHRLEMQGEPMALTMLYRTLKRLEAEGLVVHRWAERNGRVLSLYAEPARVPTPTPKVAIACRCCMRRTVLTRGGDAIAALLREARDNDFPMSHDVHETHEFPIELMVVCGACKMPPRSPLQPLSDPDSRKN